MCADDRSTTLPTLVMPNGRTTTRLGFGCAYLSPETAHLVDVAWEAGVRHFDVAPSYGRGVNEGLLGAALTGRDATVATKFGIEPVYGDNVGLALCLRALARPALMLLPGLRARLSRRIAQRAVRARFNPEAARASLARSLAALKRSSIDLLLLHEASAEDLDGGELISFLEEQRAIGVIGAFGPGGAFDTSRGLLDRFEAMRGVAQYDWSPIAPDRLCPDARFQLLYHTASLAPSLRRAFAAGVVDAADWSTRLDADVREPGVLETTLLRMSLDAQPCALVLFSSKQPEHIRANVAAANDVRTGLRAQALRLLLAGHRERVAALMSAET